MKNLTILNYQDRIKQYLHIKVIHRAQDSPLTWDLGEVISRLTPKFWRG